MVPKSFWEQVGKVILSSGGATAIMAALNYVAANLGAFHLSWTANLIIGGVLNALIHAAHDVATTPKDKP